MTANISSVNDFQGLAQLRHDASVPSQETAREAARQFEALFVQMMPVSYTHLTLPTNREV